LANIKSQIKRNRQNERRRLRNRFFRGAARRAVKEARRALEGGNDPKAAVVAAVRALDKAAEKGVIHRRNAARRKSRLMKRLARLRAVEQPVSSAMEAANVEAPLADETKKKQRIKRASDQTAAAKKTGKE